MKFIDETMIMVKAGNGGNGCLSFRRNSEKDLVPNWEEVKSFSVNSFDDGDFKRAKITVR